MTIMVTALVAICACFSLSGPWYSITQQQHPEPTLLLTKVSTFYIYRDIQISHSYENTVTGQIVARNVTKLNWNKSKLVEFGRMFHLSGPLLICAAILDFVAIAVSVITRFSSSTENPDDEGFLASCAAHSRRWILLVCGLLGTAIIFNILSSILFIASPTAITHDLESSEGQSCTTGPCHSWSGHAPAGERFRVWGPSFGWYVFILTTSSMIAAATQEYRP